VCGHVTSGTRSAVQTRVSPDNDRPPNAPPSPGLYAYTAEDNDETPVDRSHSLTPPARSALSQAEANLMMIEAALVSLKRGKRQPAPGVIADLQELLRVARQDVSKGDG
jgi:hypothetical protein